MKQSLVTLVAVWLCTGCCWGGTCAPPSQPPTPRAALERMREEHACSRALRGESRFDSFDEEGRVRAKTLFLTAHPDKIRFEILSPLGTSVATLAADGERFTLLDQEQAQFFMGPANQCNVERFIKVPIPPEALVQLLSGEAPILVHEPSAATMTFEGGSYVIHIDSVHDAHQTIALEPAEEDWHRPWSEQRLRVREVAVQQRGVELYRVELKDYRRVRTAPPLRDPDGLSAALPPSGPACEAEVPTKVRFVVPIAERDVVFEHQKVEHNPPFTAGAFQQPIPQGVRVQVSECR